MTCILGASGVQVQVRCSVVKMRVPMLFAVTEIYYKLEVQKRIQILTTIHVQRRPYATTGLLLRNLTEVTVIQKPYYLVVSIYVYSDIMVT